MNEIEVAITEHWGERCPDFDKDCPCCKAWALYDVMANDVYADGHQQGRIAGLREAAEIADRDCQSCDCCAVMAGKAIRARIDKLQREANE